MQRRGGPNNYALGMAALWATMAAVVVTMAAELVRTIVATRMAMALVGIAVAVVSTLSDRTVVEVGTQNRDSMSSFSP